MRDGGDLRGEDRLGSRDKSRARRIERVETLIPSVRKASSKLAGISSAGRSREERQWTMGYDRCTTSSFSSSSHPFSFHGKENSSLL